jgi:polycystin 1L2
MRDYFVPSVKGEVWYNSKPSKTRKFLNDKSSLVIGNITLRQVRTQSGNLNFGFFFILLFDINFFFYIIIGSCNVGISKLMANKSCHYDYNILREEHDDFNPYWSPYNSTQTSNASWSKIYNAFKYRRSSDLDSLPYAAQYSTYLGGGYVFDIVQTQNISTVQSQLKNLEKVSWIDESTRALFIEFSLYNPNINLFSYCVIVFEYLPTGSIIKSFDFSPITLYSSTTGFMLLAFACNIIYIVIISFFAIREVRSLIKTGHKKYFTQFSIYIEWLLIIFSFVAVAMYMYREYEQYALFGKLKDNSNPNETQQAIRLQKINYWTEALLIFVAISSFIAMLKFLKVISFSRNITFLLGTLRRCFADLISFLVVFIIIWIGFISLIYVTYSDMTKSCSTFVNTLETMFMVIVGKFSTSSFTQSQPILGPIIFVAFNLAIVIILSNFLISIIVAYFDGTRRDFYEQNEGRDSILMEYAKNKWKELTKGFLKMRGREATQRIYKTIDDSLTSFELKTNELIDLVHDYKKVHDNFDDECVL